MIPQKFLKIRQKPNSSSGFIAWMLLLSISSLLTGLGLYASVSAQNLRDSADFAFDKAQAIATLDSCKHIIHRMIIGNTHMFVEQEVLPHCRILEIALDPPNYGFTIEAKYPRYATTTSFSLDVRL